MRRLFGPPQLLRSVTVGIWIDFEEVLCLLSYFSANNACTSNRYPRFRHFLCAIRVQHGSSRATRWDSRTLPFRERPLMDAECATESVIQLNFKVETISCSDDMASPSLKIPRARGAWPILGHALSFSTRSYSVFSKARPGHGA